MNKLQAIISAILAISAAVGVAILKTDGYLWAEAPSHAYGLIVFVALDVGLAALVWRRIKLALLGTALLGVVQFAMMVGDMYVGGPAHLPTYLWQQYLLGDGYFVALLGIQLVVAAFGLLGFAYYRQSPRNLQRLLRLG